VFLLSFAVQGAAGTSHLFPQWWGANQGGNYDRYASLMCAALSLTSSSRCFFVDT
jgi:hypothetical protein